MSATGKRISITAIIVAVILIVVSFQVSVFVIPPIGAVPEGRTIIISRLNQTKFIDSADAMCQRLQNGVSLLCRGLVLGKVAKTAKIYIRLPYSKTLYLISTDGKTYKR